MKIIFRDDDLSYYSDLNNLKDFYEPLFVKGLKISFGTIAFQKKAFNRGDFNNYYEIEEYKPLGENKKLVEWLKYWINKGNIEIVLHGTTHEYLKHKGKWYGETYWKEEKILEKDLRNAKKYLEELFETKIYGYIPPSNHIGCKGIKVLKRIGIKYISGTITPKFNRCFNIKNLANWIKYIYFYFINGKNRIPFVLNGDLKELTYYTVSPNTNWKKLEKEFKFCKNKKGIFTIATHHWELFENKELSEILLNFLEKNIFGKEKFYLFKQIFNVK